MPRHAMLLGADFGPEPESTRTLKRPRCTFVAPANLAKPRAALPWMEALTNCAFCPESDGIHGLVDRLAIEAALTSRGWLQCERGRWCEVMTRPSIAHQPWRGTRNGEPAPCGIYQCMSELDGALRHVEAGWSLDRVVQPSRALAAPYIRRAWSGHAGIVGLPRSPSIWSLQGCRV